MRVFTVLGVLFVCASPAWAQAPEREGNRAKTGEPVVIIMNVVKADKQKQFEDYLTKFEAALSKGSEADATLKRMQAYTRVLYPATANNDGTFSYVFLIDPQVAPPPAYNMLTMLKKVLPEPEAEALIKQFMDAIIQDKQQLLVLEQGK